MELTKNAHGRLVKFRNDFAEYRELANAVYGYINGHSHPTDREKQVIRQKESKARDNLNVEYGSLKLVILKLIGGAPMLTVMGHEADVFDEALSDNFRSPLKGQCMGHALQYINQAIGRAHPLEELSEATKEDQTASDIFEILKISEFNFRKLFRTVPNNEKEVQDKYEDMLNSRDLKFSREKESVEYSSKTYIPDFTFSHFGLAVELKFCDSDKREKGLIAELNDDILAYQTKWKQVLFVIYDTGNIRDVDRFKKSFETHENVIVVVVKH